MSRTFVMPGLWAALLCGALLMGCAGAPVQQMYDARSAIRAAEKAGAAQYAPDLLAEAQSQLQSAKERFDKGDYRVARDEAESARQKAMEARRAAEAAAPPRSSRP